MSETLPRFVLKDGTSWEDRTWRQTMTLRWSDGILQQRWVNGRGQEHWRNIPTEDHPDE